VLLIREWRGGKGKRREGKGRGGRGGKEGRGVPDLKVEKVATLSPSQSGCYMALFLSVIFFGLNP